MDGDVVMGLLMLVSVGTHDGAEGGEQDDHARSPPHQARDQAPNAHTAISAQDARSHKRPIAITTSWSLEAQSLLRPSPSRSAPYRSPTPTPAVRPDAHEAQSEIPAASPSHKTWPSNQQQSSTVPAQSSAPHTSRTTHVQDHTRTLWPSRPHCTARPQHDEAQSEIPAVSP